MDSNPQSHDNRDLILSPGTFAFVQDSTKGAVSTYVGPNKTSLSQTDRPVRWDINEHRFIATTSISEAITPFVHVPEGSYVILTNPSENRVYPPTGTAPNTPELNWGRSVNLSGPMRFALWPGQSAKVIPGHNLRSNQFILVRVTNESEAQANWGSAVMKPQAPVTKVIEATPEQTAEQIDGAEESKNSVTALDATTLTLGTLIVIRGCDVSFYIPPTGLEVVPDETGVLVREAMTLERLEYCILLDENGGKRYKVGPDVIFPKPTEAFVRNSEGSKKFKALELSQNSGIYVKVIADYDEPQSSDLSSSPPHHTAGDELFITGEKYAIYYPRPEHSLIKYGDQVITHAIAIPEGEGRYVLNRTTGVVDTIHGPRMFLPDPRSQVVVRRVLSTSAVALLFPGNTAAAMHNRKLAESIEMATDDATYYSAAMSMTKGLAGYGETKRVRASEVPAFGDEISRGTSYTPPRSITLDAKFEGAVSINVWTGYAILVTKKSGARRVVEGPQTTLLEYDEEVMAMELSTGKPKTTDQTLKTAYLRVANNKISDIIATETEDMVPVEIKVSYVVNFEGEEITKWFDVENYVKFLCDRVRGLVKAAVKEKTILEFYQDSTGIIRGAVLTDKGKLNFPENGMVLADVEVLSVRLGDSSVAEMLRTSGQEAIRRALTLTTKREQARFQRENEILERGVLEEVEATKVLQSQLRLEEVGRSLKEALARHEASMSQYQGEKAVGALQLEIQAAEAAQAFKTAEATQTLHIRQLNAESDAMVKKAAALGEHFLTALKTLGDTQLLQGMATSMGPLAILGGESVADVLGKLVEGTGLEQVVRSLGNGGYNRAQANSRE